MENVVHGAGEIDVLRDIVMDELEVRVAGEMGDVVGVARDEIVDGDDAVAFGKQAVGEMGAEKTSAASHNGESGG